jgi:hypothetical protein
MAEIKRTYIMPAKSTDGPLPAIVIDDVIKECLVCVRRIVEHLSKQTSGVPTREHAAILKDCMAMLYEAKKKEDEIMSDLSEAELEKMLKK